ncbi:PTS sugar transporter subunit IIA [Lentisphaerota bacterium ZTH]|nr:PTS sugar transporter subunit IIA [Lentisphaerota bacterium]WET06479.1 PTS sugar transporter subunit IIA [Lentisphaerota bacterium ZTH]
MSQPEIMTIEEVASYLRVSERTVYDWAQKGEIPCGKLGTAWRFKRGDIEAWVDKRLNTGDRKKGDFVPMLIEKVLLPGRIVVLDDGNKADVLNMLISMLADTPQVRSKEDLTKGIYHREQLMSTGIGLEVGIPHVRLGSVKDIVMAAALVRNGIPDYESLDHKPVKLVFMIVAKQDQHAEHIKLLSQLSSRLKSDEFREQLTACTDSKTFYNLLMGK